MKLILIVMPLLLYAMIGDTMGYGYDFDIIKYGDLITAEPGTSAVILCTFKHSAAFKPTSVTLYKCVHMRVCRDDDVIFNSEDAYATTSQFRGRVSLLEPDLRKQNCSVQIDDLTISMTGDYRVGIKGQMDGHLTFVHTTHTKYIEVTGLKQPRILGETTVEEGGSLSLTCEAQSSPPSNVTWTVAGSDDTPLISGVQTATLVIPLVTTEHNGCVYICTAKHVGKMKTAFTRLSVTTFQKTEAGFLRVWLPIVVVVGAVALAAMYYFYRRRKTGGEARRQADVPQTGDGDGSAGQEQTFQEGEVAEEVELLGLSTQCLLPEGGALKGGRPS